MKAYLINLWSGIWALLVVLDKLVNAITFGHYNETLSGRMGKYVRAGRGWFPCQLCKLLSLFDKNHCINEINNDINYEDKSMFKNVVIWLLFFVPALLIELLCYALAPVVALFVTYGYRTDVVKRFNKAEITLLREYLIKPLYWFQTHDNAVDEWWYGMYNVDHWFEFARNWTQDDFNNKRWVRYYCRLMWLWRNCAYGFHYQLFSRPKETVANVYVHGDENGRGFWYQLQLFQSSFQLEAHIPRMILAWSFLAVSWIAFFCNFLTVMLITSVLALAANIGLKNRFVSINIGWKAHKTTARLLYANRFISFRSYE